jgi:peptidoglycan LD-endopeptidase LytH
VPRVADPSATPSHRRSTPPASRVRAVAALVVMFAGAIVAVVKLGGPGSPPTREPAPLAVSEVAQIPVPTSPVPTSPVPKSPVPTTPVPPPPAPPRYVFPVQSGIASYAHTHDEYPASDILAPCGSPVLAATDGVVLEVNRVDRWDPATDDGAWRGGRFLSILGDDGVRYYGGHFSVINDGLEPGVRVAAGQPVGQVGTTGKSSACHLHFGISPPCGRTGDWWNRRGVIWPWSYLDAWRAGTSTSAVPEITAWRAAHGCPSAP